MNKPFIRRLTSRHLEAAVLAFVLSFDARDEDKPSDQTPAISRPLPLPVLPPATTTATTTPTTTTTTTCDHYHHTATTTTAATTSNSATTTTTTTTTATTTTANPAATPTPTVLLLRLLLPATATATPLPLLLRPTPTTVAAPTTSVSGILASFRLKLLERRKILKQWGWMDTPREPSRLVALWVSHSRSSR